MQIPGWIKEFCYSNARSSNGLIRSAFENCIQKLNEKHKSEMKNELRAEGTETDRPKMDHSVVVAKIKQYLTALDAAVINEEKESKLKAIRDLRVASCCFLHR